MVQVKINPNLTEEQLPQLVAELEKLSSLNPVKDILIGTGKTVEPLPGEKMIGSHPRENDVFIKEFVEGALELAQMLGIEDQGSYNPSKGLSFRAKNNKFYDFMGYWSALIKRFSNNEDRMTAYETTITELKKEKESIDLTSKLFKYIQTGNKLTNTKIEAIRVEAAMFEEAAELITEQLTDFTKKAKELDAINISLTKENKQLKNQLFWLIIFVTIPCLYSYGTILLKLF